MSSDSGIYVLKTMLPPIKDGEVYKNQHGKYEYRVAWCQAIENIEYSDLYLPLLFGYSKIFDIYEDALKEAVKIGDEVEFTEYGINTIIVEKYFPNMTPAAARKALDCYIGAEQLDDLTLSEDEGWEEIHKMPMMSGEEIDRVAKYLRDTGQASA